MQTVAGAQRPSPQPLTLSPRPSPRPYLQRLGDPGFGGLVHLCLPHPPAARLAQVAQAEAQVLLVGVLLDLVGGTGVGCQLPPQSARGPGTHPIGRPYSGAYRAPSAVSLAGAPARKSGPVTAP